MKNIVCFFSFLAICILGLSFIKPEKVDIVYNWKESIKVGGLNLVPNLHSGDLIKQIGEPSSKLKKGIEVDYFYEDYGIVFAVKKDTVVGLGINFNWDGDKKFPKKSFTGSLILDGTEINKDSKMEELTAISSLGFNCPIPSMCFCKNENLKQKIMAGFNGENKLSQLVFIFN